MSLTVYSDLESVEKSGLTLIPINDVYFDSETDLKDDDMTRMILSKIDSASFISPTKFMDRTGGVLKKNCLSTGSKTLLNILSHPNLCFNVVECGGNALELLCLFHVGNILWENPVLIYSGTEDCDMVYRNKKYTNIFSILDVFRNGEG